MAATLYSQLENRIIIQQKRQYIWDYYFKHLKIWAEKNNFVLPSVPKICEQTYHMFYMITPSLEVRSKFIEYLKKHNISASFHYQALHSSSMAVKLGANRYSCPITELAADRLVRLPFYNDLSQTDLEFIIEKILNF